MPYFEKMTKGQNLISSNWAYRRMNNYEVPLIDIEVNNDMEGMENAARTVRTRATTSFGDSKNLFSNADELISNLCQFYDISDGQSPNRKVEMLLRKLRVLTREYPKFSELAKDVNKAHTVKRKIECNSEIFEAARHILKQLGKDPDEDTSNDEQEINVFRENVDEYNTRANTTQIVQFDELELIHEQIERKICCYKSTISVFVVIIVALCGLLALKYLFDIPHFNK